MTNRTGQATRETGEVKINTEICLDEPKTYQISLTCEKEEPGLGFEVLSLFEHLFSQIYHHGKFGGYIKAHGDIPHHLIEDVGISLGQAIKEALGDRKGIERFASLSVPHQGSLASIAIDLSGRGYATFKLEEIDNKSLGGIAQHLFETIAINGGFDIYGEVKTIGTLREDHHRLEAFCKAFGRALHRATRITGPDVIPSTKGIL